MIIRLFQVFDRVSGCVVGPILAERADAGAVRQFEAALKDEKSSLNAHASDYDLLCLGVQDDASGQVSGDPYVVIEGSSILGGIR